MKNKFLLILLVFAIYGLHALDGGLYLNSALKQDIQKKKEREIEPPSYYCDDKKIFSLCVPAAYQIASLLTSSMIAFGAVLALGTPNRRPNGHAELIHQNVWCPFAVAAFAVVWPYWTRYQETGYLGPICWHTAFFSPTFFIELPYHFYQRQEKRKQYQNNLVKNEQ